jgi:hypothetical protein
MTAYDPTLAEPPESAEERSERERDERATRETDDRCAACGGHLDTYGHRPGCGNDTRPASDLHRDARLILETAQHIEGLAYDYEPETIEPDLVAWAMLEEANRALSAARTALADKLARALPDKRVTVEGVGTFEMHAGKKRTKWDKEALLSAVLDSRLVDTETGELLDETPVGKVLTVWNLGVPRTTALKARNIDPDEFCETEPAPWSLQLTGSAPTVENEAAA